MVSDTPRFFRRFAYILIAPSMMGGGGHMRSGSPDPLPVPPPHSKNGYRDDRAPYPQPERHRSQRRRDHDRSNGYAPHGEVRIWNASCVNGTYRVLT